MRKFILMLLIAMAFSLTTFAKSGSVPTMIEADELIYSQKENKAIYKGNVVVKRGDLTIYANRMDVYFNKNGDIEKIVAIGNVRIYKAPNREGRGDKAIYVKATDTITLIGNAYLKQGKNIVEGEKVVYYISKEITEVKGAKKRRVKTIIFETQKKK
jgi:lipopolysaccharide export system protein LptA